MNYLALACYRFTPLADPEQERKRHYNFFKNRTCSGRIYLSSEGINAQLSGPEAEIQAYQAWLKEDPRFDGIHFNVQKASENIFPRMTIKVRKQLVALDYQVDLSNRGEHLSPEEFRDKLKSDEPKLLLDVRNQYESAIGHFEGAELPPYQLYREFPAYALSLKEKVDPAKTPVLMYCTGGIRCELFSALLKKMGFTTVFQLQGGILNYGAKVGSDHWKGKVFVFDDRLAIPIDEKRDADVIGTCLYCGVASDTYYNCANMYCNELFLVCKNCHSQAIGCCSLPCQPSPHLRPFEAREDNKPFRRKHLIGCEKKDPVAKEITQNE